MTAAAKDEGFSSKQSKNVAVIGAGVRYHLFLGFWFLGFLSLFNCECVIMLSLFYFLFLFFLLIKWACCCIQTEIKWGESDSL